MYSKDIKQRNNLEREYDKNCTNHQVEDPKSSKFTPLDINLAFTLETDALDKVWESVFLQNHTKIDKVYMYAYVCFKGA